MITCQVCIEGRNWQFYPDKALKIGITLDFFGDQPSHFFAPQAQSRPWETEGFIGNTQKGGSCNVSELTLIPHCQGTHTECLGHITDDSPGIDDILNQVLIPAVLVTVESTRFDSLSQERYDPLPDQDELLVSKKSLEIAVKSASVFTPEALIVRCRYPGRDHPYNEYGKCPRHPPFFSHDAMHYLSETGVRHLLVELPSVDRMFDAGKMNNHRIFWGLPAGSVRKQDARHPLKTITEMIWVPDNVVDGAYLLNLQIPAFKTDAAPSRPILFPMELM